MDRASLIKSRAEFLFDEWCKRNEVKEVWCEDCRKLVSDTSMQVDDFIGEATKDVDWFAAKIYDILSGYIDSTRLYVAIECGFKGKSVDEFIDEIKKVEAQNG